jgi:hypothetical protein
MTESTRWERLADDLADVATAGVSHSGESRQILIRSGRTLVVVHDTWWRKNPDVWTGWEVYTEGADGIVQRTYPRTKKRGEVRRHVMEALPARLGDPAERGKG